MAIAVRPAETIWDSPLASGSGTYAQPAGALGDLPLTLAAVPP